MTRNRIVAAAVVCISAAVHVHAAQKALTPPKQVFTNIVTGHSNVALGVLAFANLTTGSNPRQFGHPIPSASRLKR